MPYSSICSLLVEVGAGVVFHFRGFAICGRVENPCAAQVIRRPFQIFADFVLLKNLSRELNRAAAVSRACQLAAFFLPEMKQLGLAERPQNLAGAEMPCPWQPYKTKPQK